MEKIQLLQERKAKIAEAGKEIRERITALIDENSFVELSAFSFSKNDFYGEVLEETQQILADAININAYDEEYSVYIYSYVQDGLRYTFFGKDRSGKFAMYLIEKEE